MLTLLVVNGHVKSNVVLMVVLSVIRHVLLPKTFISKMVLTMMRLSALSSSLLLSALSLVLLSVVLGLFSSYTSIMLSFMATSLKKSI